jgi:ElaB/YqjD/DUF883 family membrane-anchored ribosome-binding protein
LKDERTAAQEKLKAKLSELDKLMADMKSRAQQTGSKAKAEWEARRPSLEAQRDAAEKGLKDLGDATKEGWQETRTRAEAALNDVEKGFKDAWSKLSQ